jgi:DNA-binding MarR family transcriptional regulator
MYIAQSKDGISVKELAAALQVTSGAVTQTVDGLVENGLVTRRESKSDRRVLQIILTSQARKKVDAFQKQYIQDIAPVFETLNNTEITQLTTLLTKVSNLKEKEVNKRNE